MSYRKNPLDYMSKSKVGLFKRCPYAFKLKYLDKMPEDTIFAFEIGKDVHTYIEEFLRRVKIKDNQLQIKDFVSPIKLNKITRGYVLNVLNFEEQRWSECLQYRPDNPEKYFRPILNEVWMESNSLKLIGIVDRVHWSYKDNFVIVENKTGKPSVEKAESYREDLLWYKLLVKATHGHTVNFGSIYFPYDNSTFNYPIGNTDKLLSRIEETRQEIKKMKFPPTPSKEACGRCTMKKHCKYRWKKNV